jgi:DNA-binding FadR family transcriptional regulator
VLLDALSAAYDKYLRYQIMAVVFRGEVAAVEHRELMNAALARDSAQAAALAHS